MLSATEREARALAAWSLWELAELRGAGVQGWRIARAAPPVVLEDLELRALLRRRPGRRGRRTRRRPVL